MESMEAFVEEHSPAAVSEKLRSAIDTNDEFRAVFDRELNMINYDIDQVLAESFLDTLDDQTREEISSRVESIHRNGVTKESMRELARLFNK